jgi:hypothetical protein
MPALELGRELLIPELEADDEGTKLLLSAELAADDDGTLLEDNNAMEELGDGDPILELGEFELEDDDEAPLEPWLERVAEELGDEEAIDDEGRLLKAEDEKVDDALLALGDETLEDSDGTLLKLGIEDGELKREVDDNADEDKDEVPVWEPDVLTPELDCPEVNVFDELLIAAEDSCENVAEEPESKTEEELETLNEAIVMEDVPIDELLDSDTDDGNLVDRLRENAEMVLSDSERLHDR